MTTLPNGPRILKLAQKHPEPLFELCYLKNFLVITTQHGESNALMEANRTLLDLITAYAVAHKKGEYKLCDGYIDDIIQALLTDGMNYSEFASFWPVYDTTYSVFKKMDTSGRKQLLHELVKQYIALRHRMYGLHGYTATTLQVQADSFAHKHSGALARNKIITLLHKRAFAHLDAPVADYSIRGLGKTYIFPDGGDKKIFKEFLRQCMIRFAWGTKHDGKLPDVVVFSHPHVFIIEHKHMKEGGGGQDKQIVELIDFVEQSEGRRNVHYIAFLDGTMANTLLTSRATNGKLDAQLQHIERALRAHPANYFLNTFGFVTILDAMADHGLGIRDR